MIGGIGDIFLSLERAQKEKECAVYSHFPRAKQFVESFGIEVPIFNYFDSIDNMPRSFSEEIVGYDYFPKIGVQKGRQLLGKSDKPIIGIHPFGSKLSNDYWKKRGMPIKHISQENIRYLVDKFSDRFDFVIFGSKSELCSYNIEGTYNINLPIEDIPSAVSECFCVIATDSAIKTMSAAMRIPTFVAIGNYPDPLRDQKFLIPYIQMGVMKVGAYSHEQEQSIFKDASKWINSL